MGQRIHAIFMYLNPLTFERSIVIGGKHDRLIPMGTRVTPKPPVCVGKVVCFNFLTTICGWSERLAVDKEDTSCAVLTAVPILWKWLKIGEHGSKIEKRAGRGKSSHRLLLPLLQDRPIASGV